jgi:hypothetical protein
MSLYVVEREQQRDDRAFIERSFYGYSMRPDWRIEREVREASARDGEWHAVATMPHEVVERDGHVVPAFEGDTERIEWQRRREC